MKKLMAFVLAMVSVFTLAGCNNTKQEQNEKQDIISSKEMNSLISEVRQNYEDSRLSKIIKIGIVIEKHPTLSQLEIEMDFKKNTI